MIRGNDLESIHFLSQLLDDLAHDDEADLVITVVKERGFVLRLFEEPEVRFGTLFDLAYGLVRALAPEVIRRDEVSIYLHAAAVARDDDGLLLLGKRRAGKSTLTTYLALNGWAYLTDELVALGPTAGSVLTFPRPVVLRGGGAALLELGSRGVPISRDGGGRLIAGSDLATQVASEAAAKTMVLLRGEPGRPRNADQPCRVHPVSALYEILTHHSMEVARPGVDWILEIAGLCGAVGIFALQAGNLPETRALLDECHSESNQLIPQTPELTIGALAGGHEVAAIRIGDAVLLISLTSQNFVALGPGPAQVCLEGLQDPSKQVDFELASSLESAGLFDQNSERET